MSYDYQSYTVKQLVQAEKYINSEKYPGDYKGLIEELERRKEEIFEFKQSQKNTGIKLLKAIGLVQLITAAVLAWLIVINILNLLSSGDGIQTQGFLLFGASSVFFVLLNAFAGWMLFRLQPFGIALSIVNQALAVLAITAASFTYNYGGIGGIYFIFRQFYDSTAFMFSARLRPEFAIGKVENLPDGFFSMSIDIVAIVLLVILFRYAKVLSGTK